MTEDSPKPGRYGRFGGRYVAEALWEPLSEVAEAFEAAISDADFLSEYEEWLDNRVGRPTPVTRLHSLSEEIGGGRLLVKREDLCHSGSFTINSAIAFGLLARRMGREWLVGETATGDYGVALASIAASMGLRARLFVGREDLESEKLNVKRIEELGAVIETVDTTARGRKAACAEALRHWATHSASTLYAPSSLAMPDPYPRIFSYFLSVIGAETRVQLERTGSQPEYIVAPIGSGAFGVGFLGEFAGDSEAQLVGVEAGGSGKETKHAASLAYGKPGVFQGTHSFVLQSQEGQILSPSSIAGGLCMANVGPQHAQWAEAGSVHYVTSTNQEAVDGVRRLARSEGLIVSLEAGHAIAYALKLLPTLSPDEDVVVGITGRGTRDLDRIALEEEE